MIYRLKKNRPQFQRIELIKQYVNKKGPHPNAEIFFKQLTSSLTIKQKAFWFLLGIGICFWLLHIIKLIRTPLSQDNMVENSFLGMVDCILTYKINITMKTADPKTDLLKQMTTSELIIIITTSTITTIIFFIFAFNKIFKTQKKQKDLMFSHFLANLNEKNETITEKIALEELNKDHKITILNGNIANIYVINNFFNKNKKMIEKHCKSNNFRNKSSIILYNQDNLSTFAKICISIVSFFIALKIPMDLLLKLVNQESKLKFTLSYIVVTTLNFLIFTMLIFPIIHLGIKYLYAKFLNFINKSRIQFLKHIREKLPQKIITESEILEFIRK